MINIIRALGLLVLDFAVVILIGATAVALTMLAAVLLRAAKIALTDCKKQCGDIRGESRKLASRVWARVCQIAKRVWADIKTLPVLIRTAARDAFRLLANEAFVTLGRWFGRWVFRRAVRVAF